jgi:hypothetical protein
VKEALVLSVDVGIEFKGKDVDVDVLVPVFEKKIDVGKVEDVSGELNVVKEALVSSVDVGIEFEGRDVDVDVLLSVLEKRLDVGKVEDISGELNFVDSEVTSRVDEALVSTVEIIDDVSGFVLKELKREGRDVDVDVLVPVLDVGKVEDVSGELNFVDSEVTS